MEPHFSIKGKTLCSDISHLFYEGALEKVELLEEVYKLMINLA